MILHPHLELKMGVRNFYWITNDQKHMRLTGVRHNPLRTTPYFIDFPKNMKPNRSFPNSLCKFPCQRMEEWLYRKFVFVFSRNEKKKVTIYVEGEYLVRSDICERRLKKTSFSLLLTSSLLLSIKLPSLFSLASPFYPSISIVAPTFHQRFTSTLL